MTPKKHFSFSTSADLLSSSVTSVSISANSVGRSHSSSSLMGSTVASPIGSKCLIGGFDSDACALYESFPGTSFTTTECKTKQNEIQETSNS